MIVLPTKSGLLLFRQPDHAGLSAHVASSWRRPAAIPSSLWPRFIDAVRRHDDGWHEEERGPTLDPEGTPYDFKTLPPHLHVEVWRRSVDMALDVDPYIALLVAKHGRWLYEMLKAEFSCLTADVLDFPKEMETWIERGRARLLQGSAEERAAAEPGALLAARRLLSFFDGISLMLAGAIPVAARTGPLPFDGEESELEIERREGTLAIRPWPFEPGEVQIEIAGMRIEKTRFATPEELARAMSRAPVERVQRQLAPAGQP